MKGLILLLVVVIVASGGLWFMFGGHPAQTNILETSEEKSTLSQERSDVKEGVYMVDTELSEFRWSAKKPLIDGYVNSGTIGFSRGSITVDETRSSGSFTLDMKSLKVGLTAKKPGKEGALEARLKGESFFDVAKYPESEFIITEVKPLSESSAPFRYQVTGNLTMKGRTNAVTFPATIYETDDRVVHASADFEIDRTRWDITFGSGNFFTDLGDNLIDDMVALSFTMVAKPE